ncbi:MAG: substrate-binding domain-containing protein [Christensenella sp.]|uniref:sugar ABC transporter substrate-binding protein n=1 Tax=Christensenella sp. TaxID=1935934 RepID=UPI002B1F2483|nr:substrate-binding domain-containing protein [Christensenella sp.]MEA5003200.1 substrate-binding domain-containing protein [Christensenella sp.]
MIKRILCCLLVFLLAFGAMAGCSKSKDDVKIGVSFGVGPAARWPLEQGYMEERAKELGVQIETRLNTDENVKSQFDDCKELIDSGIDVLVLIPRDINNVADILAYAKEKKVKVVDYARAILGQKVDLFVGYDSTKIGQSIGQYLAEMVYEGDYIILQGDPNDNNATLLYEGAMRGLDSVKDNINIILDGVVEGWSADVAKEMVKEAVSKNGNKVDAILAPNDKLAGACAEALSELGVTDHVVITGMDAELDAIKRIVAGTQDMTMYMDLEELSRTAIDQAYNMAMGEDMQTNEDFNNGTEGGIPASLINGQIVTKENIDKILIDSGYFTKEEVYG